MLHPSPHLEAAPQPIADAPRFVAVAARSARGPRRGENQDSMLVAGSLLAIADGVGGNAGGSQAAHLALSVLRTSVPAAPEAPEETLRRALTEANRAVRVLATGDLAGMACTAVVAICHPAGLALAHAGDSRAYLWRAGTLERLTHDHSLVAMLERDHAITRADATRHPLRSLIVRAIGLDDAIAPEIRSIMLQRDDLLLLCSDGISDPLGDDGIAAALATTHDPDRVVDLLVRKARAGGGGDDMTLIAARVG